jgi:hypothetical protein
VAVDVGHPERSDGVAQAGQRARHERAAAAEDQRPPAVGDDVAHGRAHRRRRRQRVRDADHAGGRIALLAADPHVELAGSSAPMRPSRSCSSTAAGACSVPPGRPTESIGTPIADHGAGTRGS